MAALYVSTHAANADDIALDELSAAALRIERDGLQLTYGPQDPLFAAHGGLLDLRFGERGELSRSALTASPGLLASFSAGLLLIDTGKRRVSGDVLRRAPSRLEINRELVAAAADVVNGFTTGSLDLVLAGMRRNALAKVRKAPEANAMALAIAQRLAPLGVEVVRMCGAGAGGHVLVWAWPDAHEPIAAAVPDCIVRKPALAAPGVEITIE